MSIVKEQFSAGLEIMNRPVLPLARMSQLLYLTGPFETIAELLAELSDPIDTCGISYDHPGQTLERFINPLSFIETLKNPRPPSARVLDENHEPVEAIEALELLMAQQSLTIELEEINSLLCKPCGCDLCCVGPDEKFDQDFFEIPLNRNETILFDLPIVDTQESRNSLSSNEPGLLAEGRPFYQSDISIYHWQDGWSMILPRESICPALDVTSGGCRIYPDRPEVCRRPQIFPYVLEHAPALDMEYEDRILPTYIRQNKLLAIWDCPYVKTLKDEIARYAEICGLEPVFRENKS